MTTPEVMHAKHRARFFRLLVTFLRSPALPAYLVAAFVKRLGRIALTAPPTGATFVLPFMYYLLQRHAACRPLIQQKGLLHDGKRLMNAVGGGGEVKEAWEEEAGEGAIPRGPGYDCFRENVDDMEQCEALNSSLWEASTLLHHYNPTVGSLAKIFTQKLLQVREDIDGPHLIRIQFSETFH